MDEIKALISVITFWFKEKHQLRNYYGKSRPSNFGDSQRNDSFYNKLEKELLPLLRSKDYYKIKKRIFIKKHSDRISFVHFALNNKLNGLCVDYGEIQDVNLDYDKNEIIQIINKGTNFQRLKPDFWKYDYQYPIKRNDKFDEHMIYEIKDLLLEKIK
jgi:hypothetical protein